MKAARNHNFSSAALLPFLAVMCLSAFCGNARAAVSSYTNFSTFEAVVGVQFVIRFTEVPLGTEPTDEYASLGVRFQFNPNNETEFDPAYSTDGIGLAGGRENLATFIRFAFDNPVRSLGIDFPGTLHIDLFSGATLVWASTNLGEAGPGHFAGVVSDVPFDRVVLSRAGVSQDVYIDNLHVPEPIPRLAMRDIEGVAVQLNWTTNAPSYGLEYAGSLPTANWTAVTNARSVIASDFVITLPTLVGHGYFRLRKP